MTLDAYVWRARIAPWLVVVSPVLALGLGTAFVDTSVAVGSAGVALAIAVLGSQLARDAGKTLEKRLWLEWGGPPTLTRLRFRDPHLGEADTHDLHNKVAAATGRRLATRAEEAADPGEADRGYEAAVRMLRERTRERPRFNLLFSENCDYGFRRNLTAVKRWGLGVSVGTLVAATGYLLLNEQDTGPKLASITPAVILGAALGIVYLRTMSDAWVKKAAERYADALFGAADELLSV